MLSVITVEQAGRNTSIELFHSSPEGAGLNQMVGEFLSKHGQWEVVVVGAEIAVLQDANGDYWLAQSMTYTGTVEVHQQAPNTF